MLVDTNVLVAMSSRRDSLHDRAMRLMSSLPPGQGVLPTVLAEAAYLINHAGGPAVERQFLRSVDADFAFIEVLAEDIGRIEELVGEFEGSDIGATDASLVAVAERLAINEIATFDRRHFDVVIRKYPQLQLIP